MGLFDKTRKTKPGADEEVFPLEEVMAQAKGMDRNQQTAENRSRAAVAEIADDKAGEEGPSEDLPGPDAAKTGDTQEDASEQASPAEHAADGEDQEAAPEQEGAGEKADPGAADDFMSIFESEEDEESDLQALTKDLDTLSMADLFQHAREVAGSLVEKSAQ